MLTPEAIAFVNDLAGRFSGERARLLARRETEQREFDAGRLPGFPEETRALREADWRVGAIPQDLMDRRVEITGPPERKMVINALNSGANVFMADFEDSLCPTWANLVEGQANLMKAVRRELSLIPRWRRLSARPYGNGRRVLPSAHEHIRRTRRRKQALPDRGRRHAGRVQRL